MTPVLAAIDGAAARLHGVDWEAVSAHLDAHGWALLPAVLDAGECDAIAAMYDDGERFRSHVVMARHGFGRGEYKYFAYPLPEPIAALRTRSVRPARAVRQSLERAHGRRGAVSCRPPRVHRTLPRGGADASDAAAASLRRRATTTACTRICTASTYSRSRWRSCSPSPGATSSAANSCSPSSARACSRASRSCRCGSGDGVVFAVSQRPVEGTRGTYRVKMRHGVSRLRSGRRHTLGIMFHDAQ